VNVFVLLPMLFVLIGIALYTLLGGADFGAGLWQLTCPGPAGRELREQAHDTVGPVWEANHVWLIFVLTVMWTAYPPLFGSVASTLAVPLFIAAVGIIFRGATYALYAGASTAGDRRVIDTLFSLASLLTPFALGTAVGAVATGRVPLGNAAGSLWSSWLNPSAIMIGALAVLIGAFLAAVYLCADAVRIGAPHLERRFRVRALGSGVVTGGVAVATLVVVAFDAPALWAGLVGPGLPAVAISGVAGLVTLPLVWWRRYPPARISAAVAVVAVVAGWALAQHPFVLPGLTLTQLAAPFDTLVAVVIAVFAGAIILAPSLGLLFSLVLSGRFDPGRLHPASVTGRRAAGPTRFSLKLAARVASGLFLAGFGFLTIAESGWLHLIGVLCFVAFVPTAFRAVAPTQTASEETTIGTG
jgi:cytochrome bd ubiquinol oxidase subunit II